MGAYKYIQETLQKEYADKNRVYKDKTKAWRNGPVMEKVERPANLPRARRLGYKAKQGYVVVRVRIRKGGARKARPRAGRRPRALGVTRFTRSMSLKRIAERKASKKYPNLRVLSSYYVWEDGTNHWFETIMRDPHNPVSAEN